MLCRRARVRAGLLVRSALDKLVILNTHLILIRILALVPILSEGEEQVCWNIVGMDLGACSLCLSSYPPQPSTWLATSTSLPPPLSIHVPSAEPCGISAAGACWRLAAVCAVVGKSACCCYSHYCYSYRCCQYYHSPDGDYYYTAAAGCSCRYQWYHRYQYRQSKRRVKVVKRLLRSYQRRVAHCL